MDEQPSKLSTLTVNEDGSLQQLQQYTLQEAQTVNIAKLELWKDARGGRDGNLTQYLDNLQTDIQAVTDEDVDDLRKKRKAKAVEEIGLALAECSQLLSMTSMVVGNDFMTLQNCQREKIASRGIPLHATQVIDCTLSEYSKASTILSRGYANAMEKVQRRSLFSAGVESLRRDWKLLDTHKLGIPKAKLGGVQVAVDCAFDGDNRASLYNSVVPLAENVTDLSTAGDLNRMEVDKISANNLIDAAGIVVAEDSIFQMDSSLTMELKITSIFSPSQPIAKVNLWNLSSKGSNDLTTEGNMTDLYATLARKRHTVFVHSLFQAMRNDVSNHYSSWTSDSVSNEYTDLSKTIEGIDGAIDDEALFSSLQLLSLDNRSIIVKFSNSLRFEVTLTALSDRPSEDENGAVHSVKMDSERGGLTVDDILEVKSTAMLEKALVGMAIHCQYNFIKQFAAVAAEEIASKADSKADAEDGTRAATKGLGAAAGANGGDGRAAAAPGPAPAPQTGQSAAGMAGRVFGLAETSSNMIAKPKRKQKKTVTSGGAESAYGGGNVSSQSRSQNGADDPRSRQGGPAGQQGTKDGVRLQKLFSDVIVLLRCHIVQHRLESVLSSVNALKPRSIAAGKQMSTNSPTVTTPVTFTRSDAYTKAVENPIAPNTSDSAKLDTFSLSSETFGDGVQSCLAAPTGSESASEEQITYDGNKNEFKIGDLAMHDVGAVTRVLVQHALMSFTMGMVGDVALRAQNFTYNAIGGAVYLYAKQSYASSSAKCDTHVHETSAGMHSPSEACQKPDIATLTTRMDMHTNVDMLGGADKVDTYASSAVCPSVLRARVADGQSSISLGVKFATRALYEIARAEVSSAAKASPSVSFCEDTNAVRMRVRVGDGDGDGDGAMPVADVSSVLERVMSSLDSAI